MPRHLISGAHEWINEIPTVPIYYLASGTLKIRLRVTAESHQRVPISAAGLLGE